MILKGSPTYRFVKDKPGVGNGLFEHWTFRALASHMETDTNDLQVMFRCNVQQLADLLQSGSKLKAEFWGGFRVICSDTENQPSRVIHGTSVTTG